MCLSRACCAAEFKDMSTPFIELMNIIGQMKFQLLNKHKDELSNEDYELIVNWYVFCCVYSLFAQATREQYLQIV